MWKKTREIFTLDLRSLALFRIGLGLVLLSDMCFRGQDLVAHYTDWGILPRAVIPPSGWFSIYFVNGSTWFAAALFVLAGLFAVALTVGWRTTLATLGSLYFLIELQLRNPFVCHGGDNLLRVLLFWALFLPLGSRWSIDSMGDGAKKRTPTATSSMATAAYILQLCFVYWFSVALKSDPSWHTDGSAIYYTLNIDQFATRFGQALLAYPELLHFLTFATLWLEAVGPALLFVPFFQRWIRTIVVFTFCGFHLIGLGMTLALGNFTFVCAVAWIALLPSLFWQWMSAIRRAVSNRGGKAAPIPVFPDQRVTATESRPQDELEPSQFPVWLNVIIAALVIYVFLWNVKTLDEKRLGFLVPRHTHFIANAFGIYQHWDLFAPYPLKDDGWFVIAGTLKNGKQVDLLKGSGDVDWKKPALVSPTLKNQRWRRYLMNIWRKDFSEHRRHYADYLYRDWNSRHVGNEQLARIEIYFMLEETPPDYQPLRVQKVLLWTKQ